jgi:cytochrome c oxidase cbb3-type subunit I/II
MYDRPFQWGSKRTGPDLARVGGKYPDLWHFRHMLDPREVVPGSIMPAYPWMYRDKTDFDVIRKKLEVMKTLGVPYTPEEIQFAREDAIRDAKEIAEHLKAEGVPTDMHDREIVALIAYLQRLGADMRKGLVK